MINDIWGGFNYRNNIGRRERPLINKKSGRSNQVYQYS